MPRKEPGTRHHQIRERPPVAWLRERDVDLLLCSELHAKGPLANFFAVRLGLEGGQLEGAWVSHREDSRESDLVISIVRNSERVWALVENKIAADFQPGQVAAYAERSRRWNADDGSPCSTVLIAPKDYFSRPGAEDFDVRISYEDMTAALRCGGDPRSAFLADVLLEGVEAYRRGYVPIPDEVVTSLLDACWRLATSVAPLLNMEAQGTKPKGATWIYFPNASGLTDGVGKQVSIVYKADRGEADLQFAATDAIELQRRAADILAHDMVIRPAKKSASIRLVVPAVDFSIVVDDQAQRLEAGLVACERLRAFFVGYRDVLLAKALS
jgi:hypothetical protein